MRPPIASRLVALLLVAAWAQPASALEAERLPDADVLLTLNVQKFLKDCQGVEPLRRFLEPWQLALSGDERRLKKYHRERDLLKAGGITEEEFLSRARFVKSFGEALGADPLRDVRQVTWAFQLGSDGFLVVVEGHFEEARLRTGLRSLTGTPAADFAVTRVGKVDVFQGPGGAGGVHVALLDSRTLVIGRGPHGTAGVLALARSDKGRLSPGMGTLLTEAARQHVGLVVKNSEALRERAAAFLPREIRQGVLDLKEIEAVSLGLSAREEELLWHAGAEASSPESARQLARLFTGGNLAASLALEAANKDWTRGLAGVLLRQRVVVRGKTLTTRAEVPWEVVGQSAKALTGDLDMPIRSVFRQLTSIPLWGPNPQAPGDLEVEVVRDVPYREGPGADPVRHKLDIFLPKGKKDFPVVVLVHGGGWMIGDNRSCGLHSSVGHFLASQGIAAVLPNYRLAPKSRHPEQVQDVARAVRWVVDHIGEHGGNSRRLFLMGHSAGGHLVALLAADESYLRAEKLSAADLCGVVAMSGVYRIPASGEEFFLGGTGTHSLRLNQVYPLRAGKEQRLPFPWPLGVGFWVDVFSPAFGSDPKGRAAASPLSHVRPALPPFLLLNAENDLPTLADMGDEFHRALLAQGCAARRLTVPGRNHNSLLFTAIAADDPAARSILEFLKRYDRKP